MGRGRNFSTIAKTLQDQCTSLLVDLPNHGASYWTETFDYEQMADAVATELTADFAGEGPVTVLGHSMGGKVAMVLALKHRELVSRLIVEDIAPVDSGNFSEFHHLLGSLLSLDLSTIERRRQADEALQDVIPSDQVRSFLLQNLRAGKEGFGWEPNLRMLYNQLDQIGAFPPLHTEEPYPGPVLWLGGEKSGYITEESVPVMKELFPKVRRSTVKDAGHWLHSEKPEQFLDLLRFFLNSTQPVNLTEESETAR